MDPLSIASSCVALAGGAVKLGAEITQFIIRYRESKDDLASLSRQITDLNLVLGLLKDDLTPDKGDCRVPASFRPQLTPILDNCGGILTEVKTLLSKYASRSGVRWALFGKDKVSGLEKQLDAHVKALNITLACVQLSVTHDIKADTTEIRRGVEEIAEETALIPEMKDDIAELRVQFLHWRSQQAVGPTPREWVLNRYLDSVTSYYDSIVGDASLDRAEGDSIRNSIDSAVLPEHDEIDRNSDKQNRRPVDDLNTRGQTATQEGNALTAPTRQPAIRMAKPIGPEVPIPSLPGLRGAECISIDTDTTVVQEFIAKLATPPGYVRTSETELSNGSQNLPTTADFETFLVTAVVIGLAIEKVPVYESLNAMIQTMVQMSARLGYHAQRNGLSDQVIVNTPSGKKTYRLLQSQPVLRNRFPRSITPCFVCPDGDIRFFTFIELKYDTAIAYQELGSTLHTAVTEFFNAHYSKRRRRIYEIASANLTQAEFSEWDAVCRKAATRQECDEAYDQEASKFERSVLGAFAFEHLPLVGIPDTISAILNDGKKVWALTRDDWNTAFMMGYSSCRLVNPPMGPRLRVYLPDVHWGSKEYRTDLLHIREEFTSGPWKTGETVLYIDGKRLHDAVHQGDGEFLLNMASTFPIVVFYTMDPSARIWVTMAVSRSKEENGLQSGSSRGDTSLVTYLDRALSGLGESTAPPKPSERTEKTSARREESLDKAMHGLNINR